MRPNNVHVAYLRRIEETLTIRLRRHKLAKAMKNCAADELERLWKKHCACRLWEQNHGVVI